VKKKRAAKASAPGADVVNRVVLANQGRAATLLERKYKGMAADAFAFYRGSAHLFYDDLNPRELPASPVTWCAADLHLENFGTFKGDNGLTYFDVNDFDEACLLPITWDLARFAASLWVAGPSLKLDGAQRREAIGWVLEKYREQLLEGRAMWVERATAEGAVRKLLKRLRQRTAATLMKGRVEGEGARLRLIARGKRALPLSPGERRKALAILQACDSGLYAREDFRWQDAAWRIAGLGSLGVERYVVLGTRSGADRSQRGGARDVDAGGPELIDIKEARPSVAARRSPAKQPRWPSEAARVIGVQRRCQAAAPALLSAVSAYGKSYVVRQLQPTEDRLDLAQFIRRPQALQLALGTMASVVAWDHLRSAARQGAALPDDLMKFAAVRTWIPAVTRYAEHYGRRVKGYQEAFREAWDAGAVPIATKRPAWPLVR
jgi:uncharacterized protein (DUF2252 family)